jgi:MFS family permease
MIELINSMYFCKIMSFLANYFASFKTYPVSFWLLCLNMLVFMFSFNILLPEMNDYLTTLGAPDKKWMILGLWTIAAAIARPFSGKIADNISRKSVMYFGIGVSIIISFIYPFIGTVFGFLFLRFLHGFSTGFHPTGATALIADLIPKGKRGEAMGLFGITISIGFSSGQALGSPIKNLLGIDGLFFASGIAAAFAFVLLFLILEKNKPYLEARKNDTKKPLVKKIIPTLNEIFAPEVIQPSVIMFITAMASGVYMMSVPDFSAHLGMENKGLFYGVNVAFIIVTRFLSGKFYDQFGARKNLYFGLILMIVGAILTGSSSTVVQFLFSSIIFGIAAGICSPSLFAWTADLANPVFKGRGMSTMFIALELGIASGTFMTQLIYANKPANFLVLFVVLAVICLFGILYLFLTRRIKTSLSI